MDKRLKIPKKQIAFWIPIGLYLYIVECKKEGLCRDLSDFIVTATREKIEKLIIEGKIIRKIGRR